MLSRKLASALLLVGSAVALPKITIKGSKMFYENGTQFYIQGVAYQQNTGAAGKGATDKKFKDPLADSARCIADVPILKEIGTNVIRTYAVDYTADHSQCMALLEEAGIYVISDLGEPSVSIETDNSQWDTLRYERYIKVIDELAQYDNVIGFFAGNEVSTNKSNTPASAYVKAAVRDTKAYIASKGYPYYVGYAANDDADIRVDIAHYFNCGQDQTQAIDFWGYNIYQWCGDSSIEKSGYDKQIEFFRNYSVPVFFAEYGCNTVGGAEGRLWTDTAALYSDQMTEVFSGGIIYMYFEEDNDYGLVQLAGSNAKKLDNFDLLAQTMAKVDPTRLEADQYSPSNSPQTCPAVAGNWAASSDLPPTPEQQTCDCMYKTLSCVPNDTLDEQEYGDLFKFVCGTPGNPCAGINGNATQGIYGSYSMCSSKQKLGYVLDRYYKNQHNAADACGFDGKATIVTASAAGSECEDKLAAASSHNDVVASSTGQAAKDSAFNAVQIGTFSLGSFAMGAYVLVAMGVGAGMVLV